MMKPINKIGSQITNVKFVVTVSKLVGLMFLKAFFTWSDNTKNLVKYSEIQAVRGAYGGVFHGVIYS